VPRCARRWGVHTAFYLIHSMARRVHSRKRTGGLLGTSPTPPDLGVSRIIYLGGLGASSQRSHRTCAVARRSANIALIGLPVIEFRASVVIGSGSLSFEMVRALVERLPVMIAPRWSRSLRSRSPSRICSSICSRVDLPCEESRIFEIGGRTRSPMAA